MTLRIAATPENVSAFRLAARGDLAQGAPSVRRPIRAHPGRGGSIRPLHRRAPRTRRSAAGWPRAADDARGAPASVPISQLEQWSPAPELLILVHDLRPGRPRHALAVCSLLRPVYGSPRNAEQGIWVATAEARRSAPKRWTTRRIGSGRPPSRPSAAPSGNHRPNGGPPGRSHLALLRSVASWPRAGLFRVMPCFFLHETHERTHRPTAASQPQPWNGRRSGRRAKKRTRSAEANRAQDRDGNRTCRPEADS
jgi:hypothetical protein